MEPIRLAVTKLALYYGGAAAATAIAGMLHLVLGPSNLEFNVNQGILFIVGGIAQVFWIIPMIRRWGTPWYAIGIGGTAVFIAFFFITRVPGNPITGRGGPVDNPVAITIEVMQAAFIGLAAAIMVYEGRKKKQMIEVATSSRLVKNNAHTAITVGIATALVLAGLFVLPMPMPRPAGGPPGPGGAPLAGQPRIGSPTQIEAYTNQSCTLTPSLIEVEGTPQQTEGPYFVDGMPNRSDITRDTSDGSVVEGIPLTLVINVHAVDEGTCIPLSGAQVDIWHANPQGIYSGVQEQSTTGKNFLRGYQVTNDTGSVVLSTVFPGWYEGRAIHIHVKVRTFEGAQEAFEWTSQFYLPDSVNKLVHTRPPYSNHGPINMANEEDGIYTGASTDSLIQTNTGRHLMLDLTDTGQGYSGTFNVVVNAS